MLTLKMFIPYRASHFPEFLKKKKIIVTNPKILLSKMFPGQARGCGT